MNQIQQPNSKASINLKPEKAFRFGCVRATVFLNEGKSGPFRTVEVTRSYDDDGQTKFTSSFTNSHLPLAEKALGLATDYVASKEAALGPQSPKD